MIIAHISDPHITLQNDADAQGDTAATYLRRAVAHLLALPAVPDVVLVTGDCADTGHAAEYTRFQELLHPLPMPVYVVPGNHDHREQMLALFGEQGTQPLAGFMQYMVEAGPLRLIALDSHVSGSNDGALCAERLAWLEQRLNEAPNRPTLLFMHHPPARIGLAVSDGKGFAGSEALEALVTRHPQVERIITGHVHMAVTRRFAGTIVMSCPSVAHTMLPDVQQPEKLIVQMEAPVCLLHVWQDSAGLVTYTSTIQAPKPAIELHDGTRWVA